MCFLHVRWLIMCSGALPEIYSSTQHIGETLQTTPSHSTKMRFMDPRYRIIRWKYMWINSMFWCYAMDLLYYTIYWWNIYEKYQTKQQNVFLHARLSIMRFIDARWLIMCFAVMSLFYCIIRHMIKHSWQIPDTTPK